MLDLYTETSLELKPITAASRLEYRIPRRNGSYDRSKFSAQGDLLDGAPTSTDETSFANQHLATSSSLYFRDTKRYPRTFLWRVRNQTTLEIQPADLSRGEREQKEAYLTLGLEFQDPIIPFGVTFADPANADELHAFVCTNRNEVFNVRLPTDSFRGLVDLSHHVSSWCRPIDVSSLSIDTVYQIYASTPYEVFVAFTSGKIQALRRKADSENWTQDFYDEASWGSTLRGIVSRRGQQYIEHGNTRLAATAVQGMVASPDTNFLYTICLNHTLRIWHLPSGKLLETRDLLDVARDQSERIQLSPSEPGLIRLVRHPKSRHPILATYTPHDGGQFKLWNVKGGLTDPLVLEDRYPNVTLSPPDPDPTGNTVWSLTGFEIAPGSERKPSQLWVLWRNNNYHQVYTLHFDFPTLSEAWENNWVRTTPLSNRPQAPELVLTDSQDITSKWLDFLLFPGRYSTAVLETALIRYQHLASIQLTPSQKSKPLQERMCLAVASSVSLRKYEDFDMDYDRFATDSDHQWRNLWRLSESMNDGRHAPLSLCFDLYSDMAWVMMADYCVAVRECSKLELLQLNDVNDLKDLDDVSAERWPHRKVVSDLETYPKMANVLQAAEKFRKSFSPEMLNDLWRSIEEEMFVQSEIPTPDRIVLIFNQVGFNEGLSEGAEEQLLRDLQPAGGVEGVKNDIFLAILDLLTVTSKRPKSSLRNTIFGSNLLSSALLDCILSSKQILLDLLVLTIFIDDSDDFDPPDLFHQILAALKEQHRNFWLATHSRLIPLEFVGVSAKSSEHDALELTAHNGRRVSILEDVLTKSIRPQPAASHPMMWTITDYLAECQSWISGRDAVSPEDVAIHIQCDLIAQEDIELATSFLQFQPSTPWSTYVKGRLRLARAEYDAAAIHFRKAAYTLACGKAIGDISEFSSGLLSVLDAEHFNNGMARYFQHIMELFESREAYSEAADFARVSLDALSPGQKEPVSNFRAQVLARLFTAELKCARFEAAYESIIDLPDQALQKSSTVALVNAVLNQKSATMSTPDALKLLQKLPWSLHPHLASHLDQHILSLARKQTSVPLTGQWASSGSVDYLSILHALRLSKNDYRGATAVLFDRLRIIQKSGRARSEPQALSLRHALLALINSLTCVASDEAYVLASVDEDPRLQGMKRRAGLASDADQPRKRKRIVITLDDLRREYQQVLDRCSRIERGDFDFDMDDDTDDDDDDDDQQDDIQVDGSRLEGTTGADLLGSSGTKLQLRAEPKASTEYEQRANRGTRDCLGETPENDDILPAATNRFVQIQPRMQGAPASCSRADMMSSSTDYPSKTSFSTIELKEVTPTPETPEASGHDCPQEDGPPSIQGQSLPDGTPLEVTYQVATTINRARRLATLRLFLYRVNMVFITIGMIAGIVLTYFQWRQQAYSNKMSTIQTCLAMQQMPEPIVNHAVCDTVLNEGVLNSRAVQVGGSGNWSSSETLEQTPFPAFGTAIGVWILTIVWPVVFYRHHLLSRLQELRRRNFNETAETLSSTIHVSTHVPRIISTIHQHQSADYVRRRLPGAQNMLRDIVRHVESMETMVQDVDQDQSDQSDGTRTPESDVSLLDSKHASLASFDSEISSESEDTSESDPGPEPEPELEPDPMSCSSSECGDSECDDNDSDDPFNPITPQTTNSSSTSLVVDDLIDLAVGWRTRVYRELEAKRTVDTPLSDEVRAYHHLTYTRSASLTLNTQLTAPVVSVTVAATAPWPGAVPQFVCRHTACAGAVAGTGRRRSFSGFRDLAWHTARKHNGDTLHFVCPRDDCGRVCETAGLYFEHLADGHKYSAQAHKAGSRRGSWMSGHYMLMAP